jgi:hypothetical protein
MGTRSFNILVLSEADKPFARQYAVRSGELRRIVLSARFVGEVRWMYERFQPCVLPRAMSAIIQTALIGDGIYEPYTPGLRTAVRAALRFLETHGGIPSFASI